MNGPNIKLVILDEATSALDTTTEIEIVKHFRDVSRKRGQTLVITTHRPSSLVEYAELIVYVCSLLTFSMLEKSH
jgi:putative ABC transport system ATP-binding protein